MKKSKLILKKWDHCPNVAGYVLQSLCKKGKNSPHWNSPRSLELQGLLKSVKLEDAEQDEYIHSLSRGGCGHQLKMSLQRVQRFPFAGTS